MNDEQNRIATQIRNDIGTSRELYYIDSNGNIGMVAQFRENGCWQNDPDTAGEIPLEVLNTLLKYRYLTKGKIMTSPNEKLKQIRELVSDGLQTDGGHHKQWYLAQIAKIVGIDIELDEEDMGIAP